MAATTCKDKMLRVIDPRSSAVVATTEVHYGAKGSRVVWLGNKERIFTNGFSKTSEREFKIWDARNLAEPLATNAITPLRAAAEARGLGDFSPLWCGQTASGCEELPAAEITLRLVAQHR